MSLIVAVFLTLITASFADSDKQKTAINQQCLDCLCKAVSTCNPYLPKQDCKLLNGYSACGPFRITYVYWDDAGRPTINREEYDLQKAYSNCVQDMECATRTVRRYMQRHRQDCNKDGVVDCDDFALIHMYGGPKCQGRTLGGFYFASRYLECRNGTRHVGNIAVF